MVTRKAYGRGSPGASKKRKGNKKGEPKPRIYASRAKTPAGKKRALIRAKTREAKERFKLEKLEKERKREIREAKAKGERPPSRRKSVVAQAVALTRRAVRWVSAQVEALLGDPEKPFRDFTHGPDARDQLRRLHEEPKMMSTKRGERIDGRVEEYLTKDTLPWILSLIDVAAERLSGYDFWEIIISLFSDGKTEVGSPSPITGDAAQLGFQNSFEGGGIGESYREARDGLERELLTLIRRASGSLYVLYFVIYTRAARS